jgi:outer membrane protein assembly factor BamB
MRKPSLLGLPMACAVTAAVAPCCSRTEILGDPAPPPLVCPGPSGVLIPTFQGDARRTGWYDNEPALTPDAVAGPAWDMLWGSDLLDTFTDSHGTVYAPHAYASPLYVDDMAIVGGPYDGTRASVLYVATSNAFTYAINAVGTDCDGVTIPYGAVLWRARLGTPVEKGVVLHGAFDGGVAVGVLATPILRIDESPPRLYVVTADGSPLTYRVFALDARSGRPLPGWPVTIDPPAVAAVAPPQAPAFGQNEEDQRAGLNSSPDGSLLYVGFSGLGWMMAVDTRAPRLASAFPGGPVGADEQGGIWASAGPAVDGSGTVYATTGNGTIGAANKPGFWGESLLAWSPPLQLAGTYTPFNYCQLELADADVGGDSPMLFDVDSRLTSTPHLVVFGSKQGNVYLLDRDHLPGALDARPPCASDASGDASLLPPGVQPQFGTRGPLNVFGPYSECVAPPTATSPCFNNVDFAKMRSAPARYQDTSGATYVFVSGASKLGNSTTTAPPSLVRLAVAAQGGPAYLSVDAVNADVAFVNPGSPVVTSAHGQHPMVWVLDENAQRVASLADPKAPHPILYAFDAATMKLVWRSPDNQLDVGGKYNVPAIAHGVVYVATDRVQAYGARATP